MEVSFTLKDMDQVYVEAKEYYHTYKEAIETLKTIIEGLPRYWKSEETTSYETFIELFKEKYKLLEEVCEKMNCLCKKLDEKKIEFQEVSNNVINNFE